MEEAVEADNVGMSFGKSVRIWASDTEHTPQLLHDLARG